MIYPKICECCGKKFLTKYKLKKYCTNVCAKEMAQRKRDENGQPCWRCKNACGGCNWSQCLKPVDGWVAIPVTTKDPEGGIRTYDIKTCPKFIKG